MSLLFLQCFSKSCVKLKPRLMGQSRARPALEPSCLLSQAKDTNLNGTRIPRMNICARNSLMSLQRGQWRHKRPARMACPCRANKQCVRGPGAAEHWLCPGAEGMAPTWMQSLWNQALLHAGHTKVLKVFSSSTGSMQMGHSVPGSGVTCTSCSGRCSGQ